MDVDGTDLEYLLDLIVVREKTRKKDTDEEPLVPIDVVF
jgi:hypothetical protein